VSDSYDPEHLDDEAARANIRRHRLGVAVLGVLVRNREVARFMDGDTVNRIADWCIENPTEDAIAAQLSSGFEAGYGRYELDEWFTDTEARSSAKQIVMALASTEEAAR
jgi:hypothetical protein